MELFSILKFHRSDWNSTLNLQFRFHPTVAVKLQQFALTLVESRYGLGAVTTKLDSGNHEEIVAYHCEPCRDQRGGARECRGSCRAALHQSSADDGGYL
jgi:hypothetical protein